MLVEHKVFHTQNNLLQTLRQETMSIDNKNIHLASRRQGVSNAFYVNNQLIGVGIGNLDGESIYITYLFIHPKRRSRVGIAMIARYVVMLFDQYPSTHMQFVTHQENHALIKLYQRYATISELLPDGRVRFTVDRTARDALYQLFYSLIPIT